MKKTNQRLYSLLLLIIAAATLLAFGVFTNVLTDIWGTDIKASFRNNPWLIAAFALLLAIVGYLYTKIESRSEKSVIEEVDKDQYDEAFVQFRKNLREQYQTRLVSKTARRLPVNLTAKSADFGTSLEHTKAYFKELTIDSENIASEIDKILKINDRLLLIGDPGAGKTTILLYAAINILRDEHEPKLPLILNLATWNNRNNFTKWYARNIAHSYNLSPVFVQELLRRNAVVPFFDGFDEVAEEYRNDCFHQMAAYFGDENRKQLIISSRKKEYAAAKADAPVYTEIEVQPLTLTQIKKSLLENALSHIGDQALLHALEHDRWLAEAVETPFYLNTASFLFGKSQRTLANFPFEANSTEGRQAELVEIFVMGQVPEEQDRKYLHFLAGKMEEENFLVFELVKMQPRWCGGIWRWRLSFILLGSFVCSFAIALVFSGAFTPFRGFVDGFSFGSKLGLLVGLFVSFFICLVVGVTNFEIRTADIKTWSHRTFIKTWNKGLFYAILGGLLYGLTFGLSLSFLWILVMILSKNSINESDFVSNFLMNSLIAGLVGGVAFGLRESGSTTSLLPHIRSPYKRFRITFLNYFWIVLVLIIYLIINVIALISEGEYKAINLVIGVGFYGLLFLLIPTLFSQLLQHFSLRLVLYLEGKMPLRVVTFMDRMTDQLIFEDNRRTDKKGKKRRGATWRFRHKILQDYFAGKSV